MKDTYLVVDGTVYDLVPRESEPLDEMRKEYHQALGAAKRGFEELSDEPAPCPDHEGKRLYHKQGKYGPFWSHKNDDGSYHNIKG